MKYFLTVILLFSLYLRAYCTNGKTYKADVVIYGATSAGIIAAVQIKKMGKTVILVSPDKHIGGISTAGLGYTDIGNEKVVGGLSREFFKRIFQYYHKPGAWTSQKINEYTNKGQGAKAIDSGSKAMWVFEPHVGEQVFEALIKENNIVVVRNEWLNREKGVSVDAGKITSFETLSGNLYNGKVFIDATYEGDLMAAAGVSYHVGREANRQYGEEWNGVQVGTLHHAHWFKTNISPYVKAGDPGSGLLPRISAADPGKRGEEDRKVQAYCFRMCLTDDPTNRIPFPRPLGYDSSQYALMLRVFDSGWKEVFNKFEPLPNRKTDTNNHGPFSTDNIGMNYDYPDASYARRDEIIKEHETYQKGYMYFLSNDKRVPAWVREGMNKWGLAGDEFRDNGNWPYLLYIREARRMKGSYVMTENEVLGKKVVPKSIGMGSYALDSHNIQRYVTPEGYVQNEGDIGVYPKMPYQISYGSIVPLRNECSNLLVPVCMSSSHTAYGSIRMEPVFMILGQSSGTAAVQAIEQGKAVQDISYDLLKSRLLKDNMVLEYQHK